MLLTNNNNNEHENLLLRFTIYDGISENSRVMRKGDCLYKEWHEWEEIDYRVKNTSKKKEKRTSVWKVQKHMTDWYRRLITHPTSPLTTTIHYWKLSPPTGTHGIHAIMALTNGVQSGATGSDLT